MPSGLGAAARAHGVATRPAARALSWRVLSRAFRHPVAFVSRDLSAYLHWRREHRQRERTAALRAAAVNKYTPKADLGVEIVP